MKRVGVLGFAMLFLAAVLWTSAPFIVSAQAAPAAPSGFQVSSYSSSQINLSWNAVTGATSYQVYRSTGTSTSYAWIATVSTRSYKDTELKAATRYNYKVRALKGSSASSFTAVKSTYTRPAVPMGLASKTISTTQIDLGWNAVTGATSYQVYRSTGTSTTYVKIATMTTPKYSDKGCTAGTRYNYKVRAVNSGGTGGYSAVKTAYTRPLAPTGVVSKTVSTTQIDLSWTAVTSATSYQVYRSTGTSTTYAKIATVTTPKYSDTGRAAGTRYNYKVLAVNAGGAGGFSVVMTAYTKPATPTGLAAKSISTTQIDLRWTAVAGATSYQVYRSIGASTNFTKIATVTSPKYSNTALSVGNTYNYKVCAVNAGGNGALSAAASAYVAPVAPNGVTATKVSESQIHIQWNTVAGASWYQLFMSTNGGAYVYWDAVSGNTCQYDYYTDFPGTYSYKVSAIINGIESPQSASTTSITLSEPTYTIEDGRYRLINVASGLYLNQYDDSGTYKWWVITMVADGSPEQIFTFQRQSDGSYKITLDKYPGRALNASPDPVNGANIITWPESNGFQRFFLTHKNGDAYCLSAAADKGLAVTQTGISVYTNRYKTELATLTGGNNQLWRFEKVTTDALTDKINSLRTKFPNGKYWNHVGGSNYPDGYTSTPCTHHYTTGCSYEANGCDCNSFHLSIQCVGFARKVAYDLFGVDPVNSWATHTDYNLAKIGDYVYVKNSYFTSGHAMIIIGKTADNITVVEANVNGSCMIRWDNVVPKSKLSGATYRSR